MLVTYLRRDQKKNVELALGGLSSINSILRQQQTYRVRRDDENNVAWQMVNTEKPERGCKNGERYSIETGVKSNAAALLFVRWLCGGC